MKHSLLFGFAALALAGCGLERPLEPPRGGAMPVAPRMAARAPTVDEMLAAPTTARPDRIDELLRRSEEREDDHFDLPPPDRPTDVVNQMGDAPQ
jgi:hypothetical protein